MISIHALLAESDTPSTFRHCTTYLFLSTLSLRRATNVDLRGHRGNNDFYPRSPCGERPREATSIKPIFGISIHALLAESDGYQRPCARPTKDFYPRSPCGERPMQIVIVVMYALISIHALLAESDGQRRCAAAIVGNFYPRSPCGERLSQF